MKLDIWQRRQATLIYHFASKSYLVALKNKLEALIAGTDILLEVAEEQGRDSLLADARWGVRDTAQKWSTYGFPALLDFQKSIAKQLSEMEHQEFHGTAASHAPTCCANFLRDG